MSKQIAFSSAARPTRKIALAAALALGASLGAMSIAVPFTAAHAQAQNGQAQQAGQDVQQLLARYGEFLTHEKYGTVWRPTQVQQGWRPYEACHWAYNQDSKAWHFDDKTEWGAVVHHYGRWTLDAQAGWLWVPGADFSPGWVVWNSNGNQVGWAPMPPDQDAATVQTAAFMGDQNLWTYVAQDQLGSNCAAAPAPAPAAAPPAPAPAVYPVAPPPPLQMAPQQTYLPPPPVRQVVELLPPRQFLPPPVQIIPLPRPQRPLGPIVINNTNTNTNGPIRPIIPIIINNTNTNTNNNGTGAGGQTGGKPGTGGTTGGKPGPLGPIVINNTNTNTNNNNTGATGTNGPKPGQGGGATGPKPGTQTGGIQINNTNTNTNNNNRPAGNTGIAGGIGIGGIKPNGTGIMNLPKPTQVGGLQINNTNTNTNNNFGPRTGQNLPNKNLFSQNRLPSNMPNLGNRQSNQGQTFANRFPNRSMTQTTQFNRFAHNTMPNRFASQGSQFNRSAMHVQQRSMAPRQMSAPRQSFAQHRSVAQRSFSRPSGGQARRR